VRTVDLEGEKQTFSIQIDRATDFSGIGHFIDYVLYVEDTTINEDTLFCKEDQQQQNF
jgi:hypothetical protein